MRYVDYRGKRLLYRAHVPILNVKYNGDACGPYRDRQQEGWTTGTMRIRWHSARPSPAITHPATGSQGLLGTARLMRAATKRSCRQANKAVSLYQ